MTRSAALRCAFACVLGLLPGLLVSAPSSAAPNAENLADFVAGQGCAIGPDTRGAAIAAGHDAEDVDALIASVRQDRKSLKTGDWLVLSAARCQIKPPVVASAIKLTDPEFRASISSPKVPMPDGEIGCFLDTSVLFQELRRTRSWDEERTHREYLRLLGSSLVSGELSFYSSDPLLTPMFQLTTGECATLPHMADIRRSHAKMIELFDPLVRANAAHIPCSGNASPLTYELHGIARTLSNGDLSNAWLGTEIKIIAMAAGWYEGANMNNQGTPRPPLCHMPQQAVR